MIYMKYNTRHAEVLVTSPKHMQLKTVNYL